MTTPMAKPVRRELLLAQDRGRNLVMEASPEGVYLWRKGTRRANALFLPWGAAWSVACKMEAQRAAEQPGRRRRPILVRRGLL